MATKISLTLESGDSKSNPFSRRCFAKLYSIKVKRSRIAHSVHDAKIVKKLKFKVRPDKFKLGVFSLKIGPEVGRGRRLLSFRMSTADSGDCGNELPLC